MGLKGLYLIQTHTILIGKSYKTHISFDLLLVCLLIISRLCCFFNKMSTRVGVLIGATTPLTAAPLNTPPQGKKSVPDGLQAGEIVL